MRLSLIQESPLIWAHRGGRSLAPENTLGAVHKAHESGAHGWETDVVLTADGEVILLHDLGLLRTTDAAQQDAFAGNPPLVPWRFTLKQLKELDAGGFPRKFCGRPFTGRRPSQDGCTEMTKIPTLAEALRLSAKLGLVVNVEIKDVSKAMPKPLANQIVARTLAVIAQEGMEDQVIISSFNHDYIIESKQLAPQILTGALTAHKYAGNPVEAALSAGADAWHPGFRHLTREIVTEARAAGLAINPYTVNDVEVMKQLAGWGVTGLVTDCPQDAPFSRNQES